MDRIITALKVQKRNPQRVNVFLDGEFAFGLSRIAAAWLEVGQTLSEERIRTLQEVDEQEVAYQKALHFLSFRPRAEAEIRKNLTKHKFSEDVILEVIDRLRRNQLVDDSYFVQEWIRNRSEFRPRGRRALRMELRHKGIPHDMIDEALRDLDEEKLAYKAAVKQYRKYAQLEWPDFRVKMTAYLARRGFPYGVAASVTQKVWSEQHADTETEK